jgi:dTDP-4-dehydrorhamnose 3,5-epimerase
MKILSVKTLALPEVKIISYQRFADERGYFTETFRKSDFETDKNLEFLHGLNFTQANESWSRSNVIRGLHFQWNPFMGKLVRPLVGHLIDMVLDIRLKSPNFGKIIMAELPAKSDSEYGQWIWVPPGFAHGIFLPEVSLIEYFCTGEYSPGCEAGISPLAGDLDWALCEPKLKDKFIRSLPNSVISPKDRAGFSLASWQADERSSNFIFGDI